MDLIAQEFVIVRMEPAVIDAMGNVNVYLASREINVKICVQMEHLVMIVKGNAAVNMETVTT